MSGDLRSDPVATRTKLDVEALTWAIERYVVDLSIEDPWARTAREIAIAIADVYADATPSRPCP